MVQTTGPEKLSTAGSKGFVGFRCPRLGPAPSTARGHRTVNCRGGAAAANGLVRQRVGTRIPDERRAAARSHRCSRISVRVPRDDAALGRLRFPPAGAPFQQVSPFSGRRPGGSTLRRPLGSCAEPTCIIREERMGKSTTDLRPLEGLTGGLVAVRDEGFEFAGIGDAPVSKHVSVVHRPIQCLEGVLAGHPRLRDGHRIVTSQLRAVCNAQVLCAHTLDRLYRIEQSCTCGGADA